MSLEDNNDICSTGALCEIPKLSGEIVEPDLIGLGEMLDGSNIVEGNNIGDNLKALPPPPPPPLSPSSESTTWGTGAIPQYNNQGRMLMRSPLPSPTQTVRKKVVKPHVTDGGDGDSVDEEKQKRREEEHISRLVHMAKAQQNLMTAWYAASAGAEEVLLPGQPRRKSRRKSLSKNDSIQSSIRVFFLPNKKTEEFCEEHELFDRDSHIFCCGKAWSRKRIILAILVAIFGVSSLTILTFIRKNDTIINPTVIPELFVILTMFPSVDTSNFPSESLVPTTSNPSSLPTTTPSRSPSQSPSNKPSLRPSSLPSFIPTLTPSSLPSFIPTLIPSSMPSALPSRTPSSSPTSEPSNVPSRMPSISQTPSLMPSSFPSTIFSTTIFNQLGGIVSGKQDKEQFGYGVAMNNAGTIVATGARYFGSDENAKIGRVIVYEQNDVGVWTQKGQELIGRNPLDQFGYSVALSGDGRVLAVSEPSFDTEAGNRSGNIRVFSWEETEQKWSPLGNEIPGEGAASLFGLCLSLANDGSRLVAGAPYMTPQFDRQSGRVRVFELKEGSWQLLGQALDGSNSVDWFGWSVDISDDGNSIAVGAPRNRIHGGYVRIFNLRFANGEPLWIRSGRDISNELLDINSQDRFGMSVSLDGNKVAIGSPWKDADGKNNVGLVAVYKLIDDKWELMGSPIVGENELGYVGSSICLKGDYLTIGAHGAREAIGKVSFHRYDGNDWDVSSFPLLGSSEDEEFGYFVAANQDSTRVLVGAPARKHPDSLPGSFQVFSRKA